MSFLSELRFWWNVFTTRGKPRLETEIEIVQLLAERGEMGANAIYDHFNENFDFENPQHYVYVSFGLIFSIMMDLEGSGVVSSRMVQDIDRRRMVWRLTGRGPRKKSTSACPSFQPAFSGA